MPDDDDFRRIDEDGRRYRRRLKKQRDYQAAYRSKQEKARRPDREQVAAAVLTMIVAFSARDVEASEKWLGQITRKMSENFDSAEVMAAFNGMVNRERKRLYALDRGDS